MRKTTKKTRREGGQSAGICEVFLHPHSCKITAGRTLRTILEESRGAVNAPNDTLAMIRVYVNGNLVPWNAWDRTQIHDGDHIECLRPSGAKGLTERDFATSYLEAIRQLVGPNGVPGIAVYENGKPLRPYRWHDCMIGFSPRSKQRTLEFRFTVTFD